MNFIRIYLRVLGLLGPEARLAWMLALANLALAVAQFADPLLFGRLIDALVTAQTKGGPPSWQDLLPLLATWVAVGLFTIGGVVLVALHADRLAHRRRNAVLTNYFEHILQLPLAYHGSTHSGRLMKVMLTGTDSLWRLWLAFFREHFAAIMSLVVLLPLSLCINWRLAVLLFALCVVFTVLTALVVRKTETMQSAVERHYTATSPSAPPMRSATSRWCKGFARVEAEVSSLRDEVGDRLLAAQIPVLSWWAIVAVLTRASTTLTMLSIFVLGIWLYTQGLASIGEIVMFMNFAGLLIGRLEQAVGFVNRAVHGSAAAARVLRRARHRAGGARPARRHRSRPAARPGRVRRRLVLL